MMRAFIFSCLMLAVAAPAAAAAGKGSGDLIDKQAVLADYARCVLEQAPERARQLLATDIDSEEERAMAKSLLGNQTSCARGRAFISMKTGEARGALAEAALKADAALAARALQIKAAPTQRPTETVGRRFVAAYARCLVTSSPDRARGLLATDYGSGEESAAMMAFDTALKDCMPEHLAYRMNVRDVRNHVAAVLYQQAVASGGSETDHDG